MVYSEVVIVKNSQIGIQKDIRLSSAKYLSYEEVIYP